MARLNWAKSKKLRAGEYEEKYDPGTVFEGGRVVTAPRPDSLAIRAAKAEKDWLAERAAKRHKARAKRRAQNKSPNRAERQRLKLILQQLSALADAGLDCGPPEK